MAELAHLDDGRCAVTQMPPQLTASERAWFSAVADQLRTSSRPAAPARRLGPNDCQPCNEGGGRVWHNAHGLDPDTCNGRRGRLRG